MKSDRPLTLRELNRATLARQWLLDRKVRQPFAAIRSLVAVQGQVSNAPYVGLWSRLRNFKRDDLTALIEGRRVVRAPSFRGTLQLQAGEDYLLFQPLVRRALARNLHLFAKRSKGFDWERVAASLLAHLLERPRTGVELRAKMEELFSGFGKPNILDSVRMELGLLQIPPAGVWGFTGRPTYVEASAWLGETFVASHEGLKQLVLRYLAAFGPASVQDIQSWSGLTRLDSTVEALRSSLRTFRDEEGRELFDLSDAPRPKPDTPAPVRFLPEFDNLVFGHDDRRRIVSDADRPRLLTRDFNCAAVLIDGFAKGKWKMERQPERITLVIDLFEALSRKAQNELQEEGERLLRWMGGEKVSYTIRIEGG